MAVLATATGGRKGGGIREGRKAGYCFSFVVGGGRGRLSERRRGRSRSLARSLHASYLVNGRYRRGSPFGKSEDGNPDGRSSQVRQLINCSVRRKTLCFAKLDCQPTARFTEPNGRLREPSTASEQRVSNSPPKKPLRIAEEEEDAVLRPREQTLTS